MRRWETPRRYALAYPDGGWYSVAGPVTDPRRAALRLERVDAENLAASVSETVTVRPVTVGSRLCPSCNGEGYWLSGPDGYERCSFCDGLSWL